MNDLNSIIIEGRLVKDVVTGTGKNDQPYSFGRIASNHYYRKDDIWVEQTCFLDFKSFGLVSETIAKRKIGDKMRLIGRLSLEHSEKYGDNHFVLVDHADPK